jgi:hypothetical protein
MDKGGAIFALLTVFAVMLGSWFFAGMHVSMTTEEVGYKVLYELEENTEVREYGEMAVVSTSSNDIDDAFSELSSYISGNNTEKEKVEMIYPLIIFEDENLVNMSFILPQMYDADNAPTPVTPEIKIQTIPARKVAVIEFSGYAKDEIIGEKRSDLKLQLDENGIVSNEDFFQMRYNPPWIPPALMHNEIVIEVE